MRARIAGLTGGSALIAFGISLTVKSSAGPSPWDIFHLAVGQRLGLSLGQVSIGTSLVIIAITLLIGGGWSVRWGTLVNTMVIGFCIDLFMSFVVPDVTGIVLRILYVGFGTFAMACGSVVYTRAGLGAGARDGLALVLSQRLPFTVGRVRLGLDTCVACTGWLLGGPVGLATLVIVFGTGPIADMLYGVLGRGLLPDSVRIPVRRAVR